MIHPADEEPSARPSDWRPLRIAILSSGRFHVLDLARELVRLGHEVRFYSLLPPWHLPRRGVDPRAGRWLGWVAGPAHLAAVATRGSRAEQVTASMQSAAIARAAALRLEPCDVLIGMAGMCLDALIAARRRFGAVTFVERSSQHIEAQLRLLGRGADPRWVARELREYAEADVITVPSGHVEESFLRRGHEATRLFRNPIGVDLREFPHHVGPDVADEKLRVLFAGTWSLQKGADLLHNALADLPEIELTQVGPVGDAPVARLPNVRHVQAVPQDRLAEFYRSADVIALPSRQDGFGMVLSQALASGCHILASDLTGGPDLLELSGDPSAGTIVASGDLGALVASLRDLALRKRELRERRKTVAAWRNRLSWEHYAKRYEAEIRSRIGARRAA